MVFPGIGNVVQVAEELLVAARRRHQDMARRGGTDIGEAVNNAPWSDHPGAWTNDLRLIADEVFDLPLDYQKELVFSRRDMDWRAETRLDGHVENSE